MYTWEKQRRDIQKTLDTYLGRKVSIAPRALAALQAYGDARSELDTPPLLTDLCVMHNLLRASPACATLLFKAGVKLEKMRWPAFTKSPGRPARLFVYLLGGGFRRKHTLTPTAQRVKKKGSLEELDLLYANLESSLFTDYDEEPTEFVHALLLTTDLTVPGYIRHSSLDSEREWPLCDQYIKDLMQRIKVLETADPSHSLVQFVLYEDDTRRIRLRPFGATDISRLSLAAPLAESQQYVYRGGVLQPLEAVVPGVEPDALAVFEELINSPSTSEADFQRFLERNPFFVTGLDFRRSHPQPILYRDEGGPLIPDFFLEKMDGGFDAILDLKKAYDDMVTRRPNRIYFKQHVHNAVAQLRFYREWFDSPGNRRLFEEAHGIRAYRPRMLIVIGRRHHFRSDIERISLLDGLPDQLELWTYDDLYERARRFLDFAKGTLTGSNASDSAGSLRLRQ